MNHSVARTPPGTVRVTGNKELTPDNRELITEN